MGANNDDLGSTNEKSKAAKAPKRRGSATDDVARALRSAYDETLRETVPEDFRDLLGKLS